MTTQEQQVQGVVLVCCRLVDPFDCRGIVPDVLLFPAPTRSLTPHHVDKPVGGNRVQPSSGVVRDALFRPYGHSFDQGVLHRVLSGVELVVSADQPPENLRRKLAQQALHRGWRAQKSAAFENMIGRTSMARPSIFASGINLASSSARSFESTSTR